MKPLTQTWIINHTNRVVSLNYRKKLCQQSSFYKKSMLTLVLTNSTICTTSMLIIMYLIVLAVLFTFILPLCGTVFGSDPEVLNSFVIRYNDEFESESILFNDIRDRPQSKRVLQDPTYCDEERAYKHLSELAPSSLVTLFATSTILTILCVLVFILLIFSCKIRSDRVMHQQRFCILALLPILFQFW